MGDIFHIVVIKFDDMSDPVATESHPEPISLSTGQHSTRQAASGADLKSVLLDSNASGYKHPLQYRWALWFDQIEPGKPWGVNLTPIASFETVEDFWGLYNNIIKASELRSDCYFHLFKEGIKPEWEDAENKEGGRFRFTLPKQDVESETNRLWLTTILVLIGEQLPGAEMVAGAHIFKKQPTSPPRIELWVKCSQASDRQALEILGRRLKELLQISESLQFKPHADQKKTNRSFVL